MDVPRPGGPLNALGVRLTATAGLVGDLVRQVRSLDLLAGPRALAVVVARLRAPQMWGQPVRDRSVEAPSAQRFPTEVVAGAEATSPDAAAERPVRGPARQLKEVATQVLTGLVEAVTSRKGVSGQVPRAAVQRPVAEVTAPGAAPLVAVAEAAQERLATCDVAPERVGAGRAVDAAQTARDTTRPLLAVPPERLAGALSPAARAGGPRDVLPVLDATRSVRPPCGATTAACGPP